MVFAGQDAWRKHPAVYQLWKQPIPHLKTAFSVFMVIWAAEFAYKAVKGGDSHGHGHGHGDHGHGHH